MRGILKRADGARWNHHLTGRDNDTHARKACGRQLGKEDIKQTSATHQVIGFGRATQAGTRTTSLDDHCREIHTSTLPGAGPPTTHLSANDAP